MVCIDSGVTGGFQAVLTVYLSASDGKASEHNIIVVSIIHG